MHDEHARSAGFAVASAAGARGSTKTAVHCPLPPAQFSRLFGRSSKPFANKSAGGGLPGPPARLLFPDFPDYSDDRPNDLLTEFSEGDFPGLPRGSLPRLPRLFGRSSKPFANRLTGGMAFVANWPLSHFLDANPRNFGLTRAGNPIFSTAGETKPARSGSHVRQDDAGTAPGCASEGRLPRGFGPAR